MGRGQRGEEKGGSNHLSSGGDGSRGAASSRDHRTVFRKGEGKLQVTRNMRVINLTTSMKGGGKNCESEDQI